MGPKTGTLVIFLMGLALLSEATPFLHSSFVSSSTNIKTKISATLVLLGCISLCCLIKKRAALKQKDDAKDKISENPAADEMERKLVHFDGTFMFTANDLLGAMAEVVGQSPNHTLYKATLKNGREVAVKRLKEETTKGVKEFEEAATALGKIRRRANLLPLRAYYLGPQKKVLLFDHMYKSSSLSTFLRARGPETLVPWATRMKIAKGISRGLAHLHSNENMMIHENLTPASIFIDEQTKEVRIADYSLSRFLTTAAATNMIETAGGLGYRAPEFATIENASTKSDVYNLGVIMLELLTGKYPGESTNWMGLPQWAASVLQGDWTNEAFDLELVREAETIGYGELLQTLKLALDCVTPSPADRPEAIQVVNQLEEIKPEKFGSGGDGA